MRFADEPQWLALEWTDGAPPAMHITQSRDALLTALLDAAQVMVLIFSVCRIVLQADCSTLM